ncbi:uncharacterized protein [Procambarus clarkii]|uniref:uncharacterized protein n=1 Tax=Procambarus clarkii TaxID=6728 RepID=UPI003743E763
MTMRLLLVFLSVAWVTALLCVSQVLALSDCEPDCAGKNPRDKVADPSDCTRYYLCIADGEASDVSLPCPDGTSFDSTAQDCTGTVPCKNTCILPECKLECSSDPGTRPDPKNCSSYYFCTGGNVYGPLPCPDNSPYFNGDSGACEVSPSVCCRDPCAAYCMDSQVETQDPYDCHMYYLCPASGPADPSYHFTCPSGQYFDVAEGKCIDGADCSAPCASSFPGDDTTTPEGGSSTPTSVSNTPTSVSNTPTSVSNTPTSIWNTPTSVSNTPTSVSNTPTTGPSITTAPTPNCLDSMICTNVGYFPKCTTCEQEYFICQFVGYPADIGTCLGDKVFNTNPAYAYCISPSVCPFQP